LDYIFTTDENVIDNLQYEVPLGTSDHACLVWELAVEVQETVTGVQQKLNYWKADYDYTVCPKKVTPLNVWL